MGNNCVWMPKKGKETFLKLKENFGYNKAAVIFNKVNSQQFLRNYDDSIILDEEGVPTYESIISNPSVRQYITEKELLRAANKDMPHVENTAQNNSYLVNMAIEMNSNPNSEYVAIVDYDADEKLTIVMSPKTNENLETAAAQAKIQKLNEKVVDLLSTAGVNITHLSSIEVAAGRVGMTNFNHAKDIANNFTGLIQIANNIEGTQALSEEFAHLLVGIYRDSPLMQRTISFLTDPDNARAVLGDEYDTVAEYYNGNAEMIAEEAAGKILRDQLVENANVFNGGIPIIERTANYIKSRYKGLNPGYFQDEIDRVANQLGDFAKAFITGERQITTDDIVKARRNAHFNALSAKAEKQVEVLKKAVENTFKAAALQENIDNRPEGERTEKSKARMLAERVSKDISSKIAKEETVAAIVAFLDIAHGNLNSIKESIMNLDNLPMADKFTVLRNLLFMIQQYGPTLKELTDVTTVEFMNDEGIKSQEFVVDDSSDSLKEYETETEIEEVDTEGMSSEEIAARIELDSKKLELSEDEEYYINTETGEKFLRVTQVISADEEVERNLGKFDKNNGWTLPSTNIGTGMDELFRDVMDGKVVYNRSTKRYETINGTELGQVYPNASSKSLELFASQVMKFKRDAEEKGLTFVARDVKAMGTITVKDSAFRMHRVNVAGTLDLLAYDKDGNWYIYDMKTHRSKIGNSKKDKYAKQVSLYKKFLEEKYGIKINKLSIIPIEVSYPKPQSEGGTAEYSLSDKKHPEYSGKKGNQILKDGEEFKEARPFLGEVFEVEDTQANPNYKSLSGDATGGIGSGVDALKKGLMEVKQEYDEALSYFSQNAMPLFLEFLKPFVGESITIYVKENGKGRVPKQVSIKELMETAEGDVTFLQRWLNSMADNPNALLQIFDKVVKIAKDEKRLKVISKAQEILALGKEYEVRGVTNYDRFFEDDNNNYISHLVIRGKDYSYDRSKYEAAKKEFSKYLDNKYGERPEIGTEPYKKKNKEMDDWLKGTETTPGNLIKIKDENDNELIIPNPTKYPSRYHSLTATEKEFYDKWIEKKAELDELIGPNHTHLTNTIKIRKNGIERLSGVVSGRAITEFVESTKAKFMKSFDDEVNYTGGIRGFDGAEVMKLPLYYISGKGNSKDISHDMIGTLVAYAEMAYNYDAMNSIVNPLEIGRYLTYQNIDIQASRSSRPLVETFTVGGKTIKTPIKVNTAKSNFADLLDDFFESKIYNRYLKDTGDIPNTNIDKNKAASFLLKTGSMVQLGFNLFAWIANAVTGASMQMIEAFTGEFFNARELFNADRAFVKEMTSYVGQLGQRIQTNKLALFDEMFDVRQNFRTKNNHRSFNNRNLLLRIFGPNLQYLGQDAGDHWLYNRTAIAVAMKYKLKDSSGKKISLWDALVTVPLDPAHPEYGKKLVLKDGVTKEDGSAFTSRDISDLSGRMRYINQHMFGIYNEEDAVAARRTIIGRFLLQYRDWIPAQFRYRFGRKTTNLEKGAGESFEGYYRTTGRFLMNIGKELMKGSFHLSQVWNELDKDDRRNLRRAGIEVGWYLAIIAMVNMMKGDDDKNRTWAKRLLSYILTRERTEIGALVPFGMPKEMINIMKSPFANTSIISDYWNLWLCLNPMNYTDEIKSGDYKGHSTAYRAFMRSPLTLWYRNYKRTLHPEKSERYYNQN